MAEDKETSTFGTPVEGLNKLLAIGLDEQIGESSTKIYDAFMKHNINVQTMSQDREERLGHYIAIADNSIAGHAPFTRITLEARQAIEAYLIHRSSSTGNALLKDEVFPLLKKLNPQN